MTREAERDGTQAIADALEVLDAPPTFQGLPIMIDLNAPSGTIYLLNDRGWKLSNGLEL